MNQVQLKRKKNKKQKNRKKVWLLFKKNLIILNKYQEIFFFWIILWYFIFFIGIKGQNEDIEQNGEITTQQDVIDNPYLRPGKIPKNKIPGVTAPGLHLMKRDSLEWL